MNAATLIAMGLGDMVKEVEEGKCPFCHQSVNKKDFQDPKDLREFEISGLCKTCQDNFFGKPEENEDDTQGKD